MPVVRSRSQPHDDDKGHEWRIFGSGNNGAQVELVTLRER